VTLEQFIDCLLVANAPINCRQSGPGIGKLYRQDAVPFAGEDGRIFTG
jgi:hypothetical protein